ncbi:hypothetical protein NDU88_001499 [Pleurodeles waltl]|uniref:Uncharacterized protein n=1 Tax=Pleurodeles waltl TaxID=8319 RepID=A0AAV7KT29_PLEWA|nr:hypothetical protein NDU88_001499 [Pleurodeles waltl]
MTIFPSRNPERKGTRPNPMVGKIQSNMESTPMRNGTKEEESLGLMTRKDFFEEKQLVTLRPNTRRRTMHNMCICSYTCHRTYICLFAVFPIFGIKFLVFGDEFPIRGFVGDPERDCRLTDFEFLV